MTWLPGAELGPRPGLTPSGLLSSGAAGVQSERLETGKPGAEPAPLTFSARRFRVSPEVAGARVQQCSRGALPSACIWRYFRRR